MYDYIIIGGGIVGVSTAWQLKQQRPDARVLLVEKEAGLAYHQTGRNSGVIHAGVYYQPGSLKADFCRRGAEATKAFCKAHNIPVETCGKLLVATNATELERMHALYQRCRENRIAAELWDQSQLRLAEPDIQGLGAIKVHATGIVDFGRVTRQMAQNFTQCGGELGLRTEVTAATEESDHVTLTCRSDGQSFPLKTRYVITCGGLMADRLCRMLNIDTDFQIVPYRGEYYRLAEQHNQIVKHLIYPIPDPELPFLGVHLTRMIDGSVTVGPNAVQGWKREGYKKFNFSLRDTAQMLSYPGFWRVSCKHIKTGLKEWLDALWKQGYLKRVQKYCPSLTTEDLKPYPAGVRAQAVLKDGTLVHDFLFARSPRSLHVCNAPSPAATSAIPIGEYILSQIDPPEST